MSSVLGVSVGAGAIHVARPHRGNSAEHFAPERFDQQTLPVNDLSAEELTADAIGHALVSAPDVIATAVAYRTEQQARSVRAAMARRQLTNYELVPEVVAAVEFLLAAGELQGYRTIALYDLGSSGLSVSVVDLATRQVYYTERTSDISGDYLDSLIREQQIASGRIAHPPDPDGLAALDELCRRAKEQLTGNTAVAMPSEYGLVLISQENFEALIMLAVEASARLTRDVIERSEQAVQAVVAIGGCAQIPLVARTLGRWSGMPVVVPAQPDTVVARGAGLLARPARPLAPQSSAAAMATDPTEELTPVWLAPQSGRGRRRELAPSRRRELSVAGVAVGALVVIAALGSALGWGPHVLQGDSQSSNAQTSTVTTSPPSPPTSDVPPVRATDTTNASVAAPPQEWTTTTDAPPTTVGPNTLMVPGLPPIVVPTLPPGMLPQIPMPGAQENQHRER